MSSSESTPVYPQPTAAETATQMLQSDLKGNDLLDRPVICKVPYATRYQRVAGESEYHFFKRERNSLSVYMEPVDNENDEDQENDFEDQWALLDKKAALTFAEIDVEYRSKHGEDMRFVKPTYIRQKAKRQSVQADRARKLMFTLKYLLALKKAGA